VQPCGYHDSHNNTPERSERNSLFLSRDILEIFRRELIVFLEQPEMIAPLQQAVESDFSIFAAQK